MSWFGIGKTSDPISDSVSIIDGHIPTSASAAAAKPSDSNSNEGVVTPFPSNSSNAPASVPIGTLMPFLGTQVPEGWLLMKGDQVSIAQYPELAKVVAGRFIVRKAVQAKNTFLLPSMTMAYDPRMLQTPPVVFYIVKAK